MVIECARSHIHDSIKRRKSTVRNSLDTKTIFPLIRSFSSQKIVGEHKPKGWEFNIHKYNMVEFVECIEDWCYAVPLCRESTESNQIFIKFQPSKSEANMYKFNKCLKRNAPTSKTTMKD